MNFPRNSSRRLRSSRRDSSRLMAIDRSTGEISHRHFYDIADYLNPGDLLVMNDSKVSRRVYTASSAAPAPTLSSCCSSA